jgi:hypothetical protein
MAKKFVDITPFGFYVDLIIYLLLVAYAIYALIQTFHFVNNAYRYQYKQKRRLSVRAALKGTFWDDEDYFTLYDIIRLVFIIPPIIAGFFILLLIEGAYNIFPFLRKILGFKLFRIEKEKKQ